MADSPLVMYAALATAAVCIVLMWRLSRSVARPVAASAGAPAAAARDDLLLKFVVDASGGRRGETVAVDGERLVLKTPEGFASLPADRFKADGANLKVEGDVDWVAARAAGEEWRSRSYKEITYSADEVPKEPA